MAPRYQSWTSDLHGVGFMQRWDDEVDDQEPLEVVGHKTPADAGWTYKSPQHLAAHIDLIHERGVQAAAALPLGHPHRPAHFEAVEALKNNFRVAVAFHPEAGSFHAQARAEVMLKEQARALIAGNLPPRMRGRRRDEFGRPTGDLVTLTEHEPTWTFDGSVFAFTVPGVGSAEVKALAAKIEEKFGATVTLGA